jgi:cell division protein ZipA
LTEFRWILLGLGLLLIAGIWWWGARHSRQAPGNAELREPSVGAATPAFPAAADPPFFDAPAERDSREWGVPPFEPLNIRTAEFERVPGMDVPMRADVDALDGTLEWHEIESDVAPVVAAAPQIAAPHTPAPRTEAPRTEAPRTEAPRTEAPHTQAPRTEASRTEAPHTQAPQAAMPTRAASENSDRFTVSPQVPNVSEVQRIVTVRVCASGELRWSGNELMAALQEHGLAHGRYQVFHRKHSDGRTLFCAASLVEPGTFDMARMPEEEFRGLTLFAVLPGPAEPLHTLDALFATAYDLAETLCGAVQDAKGEPLSPARVVAMREDVARFQAQLT